MPLLDQLQALRRCATFLVPLALVCGCRKLTIVSHFETGVPSTLLGEWRGSWLSTGSEGSGDIVVRVQEFADEPVIEVELDNPCILPANYELEWVGASIELRSAGQVLLSATFGADRTMTGSYTCTLDAGSWRAAWDHELPEVVDLSGVWSGVVEAQQAGSAPMNLELTQEAWGGGLRLIGALSFPDLLPIPLPVIGGLRSRVDGFDVQLGTMSGVFPALQMSGSSADLSADPTVAGVIVASGSLQLPHSGAWSLSRAE